MTKRKAFIISETECRVRDKKSNNHKIINMYALKDRYVDRVDNDGCKYTVIEQDFILVDGNVVVGFLINPTKGVMNDVYFKYFNHNGND